MFNNALQGTQIFVKVLAFIMDLKVSRDKVLFSSSELFKSLSEKAYL
jgi:hypothetical protein